MEHLFLMFLDHTQRRSTVGRTPLDEWSALAETSTWQHTTLTTDKYPCPGGIRTHDLSRWAASGRSPAEIVGLNPNGAWIFVCCKCRVLSGRGLCDELITRLEESYRLWCVVVCDLETSRIGAPYIYIYIISCLRDNTSAHCSGRKQVKG